MKKQERSTSDNTGSLPRRPMVSASRSTMMAVGIAALLATVTIAAYWGITANEFICLDDVEYITDNPHINKGLSWENVKWAFGTGYYAANWHPLTWMSHMLDVEMFGLRAGGHHLVNLGFHVANTLLLFAFLRYTTGRPWAAAFVAALFALHPLHVESVAWAAERKDVLSAFFWMCTMLAYAYYAKKPGIWRYLSVLVLYAFGLLSKPMLVTLPLVMMLLDYWPLERIEFIAGWPFKARRLVIEKLPLLVMAIGSAAITVNAQHKSIITLDTMDYATRITNIIVSYGRYLWEMLWPAGIAVFHPRPDLPLYWQASMIGVAILAATFAMWRLARTRKYIIAGWLWYLVTLVPVIGIIQVGRQSHADRYTYIPLTGIFIIIAYGAGGMADARPFLRRIFAVAGSAILLTAAAMTWRTAGYWKDEVTLFRRAMAVTQENTFIHTLLGRALMNRGEYEMATMELKASLAIGPTYETLYDLGRMAQRQKHFDEAVGYYQQALSIRPNMTDAIRKLGVCLLELRRYGEAEQCFRYTVKAEPADAAGFSFLAMALDGQGKLEEAEAACQKAIALDAKFVGAHQSLGWILAKKGDHAGAAEEYRKNIAIEPDFTAWNNLGDAQLQMKQFGDAEKSFRQAMTFDADNAIVRYNLGMALVGLGRREEALEEARKALAIDPNYEDAKEFLKSLGEM